MLVTSTITRYVHIHSREQLLFSPYTYGSFSVESVTLVCINLPQGGHVFVNRAVVIRSNLSLFFFFSPPKELVEYYKHHSLKEGFRTLDTTLQFPYKEPEHAAGQRGSRTGNSCEYHRLEHTYMSPKCQRHNTTKHLYSRFRNITN